MSEQSWFQNELAEAVYRRTYSRFRYDLGRRETWEESVQRVTEFLAETAQGKLTDSEVEEIHDAILRMDVLPSMRLMALGGEATRQNGITAMNCSYLPVDSIDAFVETLYILMAGTGVGFSVEDRYVSQLPVVSEHADELGWYHYDYHTIEDTTEGWADALKLGLETWWTGHDINFDYSQIRPAGTPLKTKGGRASGPEPLRELLDFARNLVLGAAGRKITSLECLDLETRIASIVVVGGVRRCLPAGTRVHTRRGALPIEDVFVGDEVVTSSGYRRVTNTWDQGIQRTVEILLENGKVLRCTPNHRVAVLTAIDGSYRFVQASDLRADDRLIFLNTHCDGIYTKLAPLPEKRKSDHSGSFVVQPDLTEETSWFLGEFFANGYVQVKEHDQNGKGGNTQLTVAVNAKDTGPQEKVRSWFDAHGLSYREDGPKETDKSVKLRSANRQIARWMSGYKQPKQPLVIPEEVWRATPSVRGAFIAGVMDGDGSVSGGTLEVVGSTYESFIDDMMDLLASLGIISERHTSRQKDNPMGWGPLYHISIRSRRAQRIFMEIVGPHLCRQFTIKEGRGRGYTVPNEMARDAIPHRVYKKIWCPSLDLNSDTLTVLTGIDHYTPVKVVSVTPHGEAEQTYDIEVEDNHEFVAEGFLVHNSSEISLSDLSDTAIRDAKVGEFWNHSPHRALSNNSAVYETKPSWETFKEEWNALAASGCGERGIFNRYALRKNKPERREDAVFGGNPCLEICLLPYSFCNLSEVVARADDTRESLARKVRLATIIGTVQSTITNFPYLRPIWKENAEKERLLGVSVTGQVECPTWRDSDENMRYLKQVAIDTNLEYAKRLGINQSAAITCTKPSGTASCVVNAASGIHPRYAKYYIRRMRISASDPLLRVYRHYGVPMNPEVGQEPDTANTWVVDFPVASPEGAITRRDITAIEQVKFWLRVKKNWAEHTISCTVYVERGAWDDLGRFVWENFDDISGLSFLPKDDEDFVYQLAPFEEITAERYRELVAAFPDVNYGLLRRYEKLGVNEGTREYSCVGDKCEVL